MSDSSIVWNPRIDDPSNPMPSANSVSSRSCVGIEKCCHSPGTSMNRKSTIFAPRSLAAWMTSFGVFVSSGFTSSAMQVPPLSWLSVVDAGSPYRASVQSRRF